MLLLWNSVRLGIAYTEGRMEWNWKERNSVKKCFLKVLLVFFFVLECLEWVSKYFFFPLMVWTKSECFSLLQYSSERMLSIFIFCRMVRNEITKFWVFFFLPNGSERNFEHFYLLQNGLQRNKKILSVFLFSHGVEQNSEHFLSSTKLFWTRLRNSACSRKWFGTKFWAFLSSEEWLGTEFIAFSVQRNRRNFDGMNKNFHVFCVPRIIFSRTMATLVGNPIVIDDCGLCISLLFLITTLSEI